MSGHRSDNGNGKMTAESLALAPREVLTAPKLRRRLEGAVAWLKATKHVASCACVRCMASRTMARDAVRWTDCDCGHCSRCWAAAEIRAGRL